MRLSRDIWTFREKTEIQIVKENYVNQQQRSLSRRREWWSLNSVQEPWNDWDLHMSALAHISRSYIWKVVNWCDKTEGEVRRILVSLCINKWVQHTGTTNKPQKDPTNSYDFNLLEMKVRWKIRNICQNMPQPICKPEHIHDGKGIFP